MTVYVFLLLPTIDSILDSTLGVCLFVCFVSDNPTMNYSFNRI